MKGLQMMLKSLGISIDPAEVEALWRKLSVAIPQFLVEADKKITSIESRLAAIESRHNNNSCPHCNMQLECPACTYVAPGEAQLADPKKIGPDGVYRDATR